MKDKMKKTKPAEDYKIRFNEKLSAKEINAILDVIDREDGYCPCQGKSKYTKCHCRDFIKNKGLNEPCICKLYVKMVK